jgi:UDP-N-acetylglucosamine:LPS N-acetylglucosamine transferase
MILNPKYYEPVDVNRGPDRAALGLDPDLPTALMMFGGEGSPKMLDIARALDAGDMDLQIIAICGKSKKLEAAMRGMKSRLRIHVEGFTREVPRFMRLADFFIGKPGPGSISEAVAMGLPVIIERNYWTLPQERFNADWVEEQGVGISLHSFRHQIVEGVRRMIDPQKRCEFVKRVGEQNNRAVFEIPEILERILATAEHR